MRHVMFICSGNYYRSRFAEAVFNHHALERGAKWRAFSRGLATHLVFGAGDLSMYTRFALMARDIPLDRTGERPTPVTLPDLEKATLAVALKEAEHRRMMREQFPEWEDRITYWHVHDLDAATPEEALPEIETRVLALLESLAQDDAARAAHA
ncbi:low molecular weight phosphatase family protein [Opitutales bacterium ASA1]|uniref:arsenate-mycothiol transferase ArsC n=1 Tax=Congregicoccus parvus TaxID=3081749 RepID=UPI002B2D3744|nr:low molecular weight phosphatase family protein [Opitutales bacterium ASA1]